MSDSPQLLESWSLEKIKPHPLNAEIYQSASNVELVQSIIRMGLLEPLVVNTEGILISGHRRLQACRKLEIPMVRVRVESARKDLLDELLVEFNRYRTKTAGDKVREIKHLKKIWGKRQGERTDLQTSVKIDEGFRDTRNRVAHMTGISTGNISKLLFIDEHQEQLLRDIDDGRISIHQAYQHTRKVVKESGYKKEKEQTALLKAAESGERWKVIVGDSRLIDIEPGTIQTIITSPPYWNLRDYDHPGQMGSEATEEEFIEGLLNLFQKLKPTLKKDGCLFVELSDCAFGNQYSGTLEKFVLGMISRGWKMRERIVAARQNAFSNRKRTFVPSWSMIYFFTLSNNYKFDRDRIRRPYEGKRLPRAMVWVRNGNVGTPTFPNPDGKPANSLIHVKPEKYCAKILEQTGSYLRHPAPFSRDLVIEPILATTDPGDIVLDPFSGLGTTGVAALELHRNYLGIELNPAYGEVSRKRLEATEKELLLAQDES